MPNLLNSFGRVKTYVSNDGLVVFDSTTAGRYDVGLGAGIYHVIIIGGGGGGAYCHYGSGHSIIETWGQGGVAATIDCIIRVPNDTDAVLVLGDGGKTNTLISQGAGNVTGGDGSSSYLAGIIGVALIAGAGTGGRIAGGTSATAGTMGTAVINGINILDVTMNSNDNPITSGLTRGPARNYNYMPNYFYGRGGGATSGVSPTIYEGGVPYCHIEKIDADLYNL